MEVMGEGEIISHWPPRVWEVAWEVVAISHQIPPNYNLVVTTRC